jgi:hypothetical protein
MFITSLNLLQLAKEGSLNKNPTYTGKVQFAVDGRLMVLIMGDTFRWLNDWEG